MEVSFQVIAIVADSFTTVFEMEVMRGLEKALTNSSQSPNLLLNQYTTRGESERRHLVFKKLASDASAVIALSLKPDEATVKLYENNDRPLVLIEEDHPSCFVVKTDNRRGAALAVQHLLSRGRKRIALVSGLENTDSGLSARERQAGYAEALTKVGIIPKPEAVIHIDGYSQEDGMLAFSRLASRFPNMDGVFCASGDLVAAGFIQAAVRAGRRVPEDIAVIGFDDSFIAPLVSPALTSIHQPLKMMGEAAIGLVLKALGLAGSTMAADERRVIFQPELVIRQSA